MRKIVFDIETKNTFYDTGTNNPADLDISLVGVYDSSTDAYETYLEGDLKALWPVLEKADILIGYNSEHFDLPLLNKYYHGDLSKIKHVDLLKEIKQSVGRRMKLDQVAEGTLGVKKSGHGLQAITWWKNGEIDKIKQYCLDDVKITRDLYEYARKHNLLKFKEGPAVLDIKLDAREWENLGAKGSMTHSLPF